MVDDSLRAATRLLVRHAAILILLSLLTGLYIAAAMTGKVDADVHETVASHLNAMLGGFWVLGVAFSLPLLRYGAQGRRWLSIAVVTPQYANWFITGVKALLKVKGVGPTGDLHNDAVLVALTLLVVLPSLGAAVAWIYGLRGEPETGVP